MSNENKKDIEANDTSIKSSGFLCAMQHPKARADLKGIINYLNSIVNNPEHYMEIAVADAKHDLEILTKALKIKST